MWFDGPQARYQQVADALTRQIHLGDLKARQRLPSEPDLAVQCGVSRVTIRKAIAILEKRRLVTRRRGIGTFVTGPKVRQEVNKLGAFYDAMVAQGVRPDTSLLDFRLVTTDAFVASVLHQTRAMMLMRQYLVDEQPIALTEGFLHPDAACVSWSDAEQNSVVQIIESTGRAIDDVDLKIRADIAGQRGKYLGLQPHGPVLVLERVSADENGMPLEFTSLFMRSDAYEFGLNLKGPFHFADGFLSSLARNSSSRNTS